MSTNSTVFEGNLALDIRRSGEPSFSVIPGGLSCRAASRSYVSPHVVQESSGILSHARSRAMGRLVAALTCIAFGCALIAIGGSIISSVRRAQTIESVSYERVSVRPGDSVWSISEAHPVDGLSTQDVEDLIQEQNGLQNLSLQPGVTLLVPSSK